MLSRDKSVQDYAAINIAIILSIYSEPQPKSHRQVMNLPILRCRHIPTSLFLFYINAILTANLLVSIQPVSGLQWDISLKIDRKAEDAVGGEAFGQQPLVSIYNRKGTVKQYGLVGRVIATLHCQNTGFIEKDPDNYRWPEIEKLGILVRGECVLERRLK